MTIMPIDLTGPNLKLKYRSPKPRGRNKADYNGNTGTNRHKHLGHPAIHGIRRKRFKVTYLKLRRR